MTTAKGIIILVCKYEKKPTLHTIDGRLVGDDETGPHLQKFKDIVLYTCNECNNTYAYRVNYEPRV